MGGKAYPSKGYLDVTRAYPCDADGSEVASGRFCALEIAEGAPARCVEWETLSCRYITNDFRVTQLTPLAGAAGEEVTGLVFDACTGCRCPDLAGWENGENTLRYGFYTPENPQGKKLPLLVWLHGAGEGGEDPRVTYTGNHVTLLSEAAAQKKLGGAAWVLAPQCPTAWMDDGSQTLGRSNRSIYTKRLKACIDGFIAEHAQTVDTRRIYLSGISNGGFMTMRMLFDYPDFFAAAAPGCQAFYADNATDEMVQSIRDVPIWFTHAKADELVDPRETSLPLYHRLRAAGGKDVHLSLWDAVVDPTGLYKDEYGRPRRSFSHAVWVLMLNDACCLDLDGRRVLFGGEPVTLLEWLGRQSRQPGPGDRA